MYNAITRKIGFLLALRLFCAVPGSAAEPIRAIYWGMKPVAQADAQLAVLRAHGLNTALVKDGSFAVHDDLWREWGKIAGARQVRLLAVVNFAGGEEIAALRGTFAPYTNQQGRAFVSTPCPLDARYWRAVVLRRFQRLAALALTTPLAGAVFDTEMYGGDATLYDEACLCDACWLAFAGPNARDWLSLPAAHRGAALQRRGLTAAYTRFQAQRLQAMLTALAHETHRLNPQFQIGFLAYRRHWFYDALIRGLGHPDRPVLVFSETSYVRGFTAAVLAERAAITGDAVRPLARYIPGLWLGRFFPEDVAAQLYHLAANTDGYWLFTADSLWKFPQPEPYALHGRPAAYWNAMQRANTTLDRSGLVIHPTSFYDPTRQVLQRPAALSELLRDTVPRIRQTTEQPQNIAYRGKALIHVWPVAGGTVRLERVQLAAYPDAVSYMLFDAEGSMAQARSLTPQQPAQTITLPSDRGGVVSVLLDAGANATRVTVAAARYVVEASATFPCSLWNASPTYHFAAPAETRTVKLRAYTADPEAAFVTLCAPGGRCRLQTMRGVRELKTPARLVSWWSSGDPPRRFGTLGIHPAAPAPFEDVSVYFINAAWPYLF